MATLLLEDLDVGEAVLLQQPAHVDSRGTGADYADPAALAGRARDGGEGLALGLHVLGDDLFQAKDRGLEVVLAFVVGKGTAGHQS